jgi:hypothetical protein
VRCDRTLARSGPRWITATRVFRWRPIRDARPTGGCRDRTSQPASCR